MIPGRHDHSPLIARDFLHLILCRYPGIAIPARKECDIKADRLWLSYIGYVA